MTIVFVVENQPQTWLSTSGVLSQLRNMAPVDPCRMEQSIYLCKLLEPRKPDGRYENVARAHEIRPAILNNII